MDRVTEITESMFNALAQLERMSAGATPVPELLHEQLSNYVAQCGRQGAKLGLSQQDADDIRYALAALADEIVLQRGGELREFWLPRMLQLRFFNENRAGDGFFERLRMLEGDPSRADALKVYFLCLMFGFRGKYRVRGGELELADITDRVRDALARARVLSTEGSLSPRGERPYEPIADGRRNALLVWIAGAAAVSSTLFYLGLRLSLVNDAERLVERLIGLAGS